MNEDTLNALVTAHEMIADEAAEMFNLTYQANEAMAWTMDRMTEVLEAKGISWLDYSDAVMSRI